MNPMQSSNSCTPSAGSLPISLLPIAELDLQIASQIPASKTISAAPGPGDRDRLVVEHLPMVRFVARRIHERLPQHIDLEDLVSAGTIGLIDAVAKFDDNREVQFKSYAQFRIRGAILDSLRLLDWSPRELRRKGRAAEEAIRALGSQLGRTPLEGEIAERMGLPLSAYQHLLGELKSLEIGSLHAERNEESGEEELAYVPGPMTEDPLWRYMQGETRDLLIAAIDALPERERLVLTLYYYEELTMKEIALTLDVVESRISQIHSSAVLHLRSALRGKSGAPRLQGKTKRQALRISR